MLRSLYLSPMGFLISLVMNVIGLLHRPFMVYGYFDRAERKWRKNTRISSTATLIGGKSLAISDHVWIWHHSIIDASNGVTISEGSQIGAWVGIFSHGSQVAVRLYGSSYIAVPKEQRLGYTRGSVTIGRYCFLGAGVMVLPGVTLGDGCLVATGAVVSTSAPSFSVLRGNPAKVVGDSRKLDAKFWADQSVQNTYFDPASMRAFLDASSSRDQSAEPIPKLDIRAD
jgi:acetyltransferase-like isoleucine patch superfamily enzyme